MGPRTPDGMDLGLLIHGLFSDSEEMGRMDFQLRSHYGGWDDYNYMDYHLKIPEPLMFDNDLYSCRL